MVDYEKCEGNCGVKGDISKISLHEMIISILDCRTPRRSNCIFPFSYNGTLCNACIDVNTLITLDNMRTPVEEIRGKIAK